MSDFGLGLFQAGSSVLTAPMNFALSSHSLWQQQKQFEANQQLQKDLAAQYNQMVTDQFNQQLDFQKSENELMRQREDNAVQRRAIDLKKAGINPLLAGSGGASASLGGTSFSTPNLAMPQVSSNYPTHVPRLESPDLSSAWLSRNYGSSSDLNIQRIMTEKTQSALNEARTDESRSRISVNSAQIDLLAQQVLTEENKTKYMDRLRAVTGVEFYLAMDQLSLSHVKVNNIEKMTELELDSLEEDIRYNRARTRVIQSEEVREWLNMIWDNTLNSISEARRVRNGSKR